MSLPFKIVFVHGYTASHLVNWYPKISQELNKLSWDYAIPDLPGGKRPHAKKWLKVLHQTIAASDKPLVLVGQSLGTRAVLLYLEKYRPKVEQVFLIAALANRLENAQRRGGGAYPDFFDHQININNIRPLVKQFFVLHSRDDSSIPYEQGVEIAKDLNAKLLTYENRDHLFEPENAAIILEVLKRELT